MQDEFYMKKALALAARGRRWVSPNPMVGAVLVKDGQVIGWGYHKIFGGPHAEVEALKHYGSCPAHATLYVNLEPCCHQGKTPPCTKRILEAGVQRVVVGVLDPNPLVRGKGVQELREHGLEVKVGVLEERCRELNRVFFYWMERSLPWVTLKWAQSLDGRIATRQGDSRWISSEQSRRMAHALRSEHDAVLVGASTVRTDDPSLTVRHIKGRNPLRVILASELNIPLDARVLDKSPGEKPCWVACSEPLDQQRAAALEKRGVRLLVCPRGSQGGVELSYLLKEMAREGISSVLVEGGARTITSFLRAGLVQRVVCFVAPVLLGEGIGVVGDLGLKKVSQAIPLLGWKLRRLGRDLVVDVTVPLGKTQLMGAGEN
jgi:diaminohydroxyphosphoribosylaminopyrimidine deaminase/5-amino-6-(5-phosphoribosylamino)uracil reductase